MNNRKKLNVFNLHREWTKSIVNQQRGGGDLKKWSRDVVGGKCFREKCYLKRGFMTAMLMLHELSQLEKYRRDDEDTILMKYLVYTSYYIGTKDIFYWTTHKYEDSVSVPELINEIWNDNNEKIISDFLGDKRIKDFKETTFSNGKKK